MPAVIWQCPLSSEPSEPLAPNPGQRSKNSLSDCFLFYFSFGSEEIQHLVLANLGLDTRHQAFIAAQPLEPPFAPVALADQLVETRSDLIGLDLDRLRVCDGVEHDQLSDLTLGLRSPILTPAVELRVNRIVVELPFQAAMRLG